jgi:hypothetical protein
MSKNVVFFGGCTGIGKSKMLEDALGNFCRNSYVQINVSDIFEEAIARESGKKPHEIMWHQDQWKKHDSYVLDKLVGKINAQDNKAFIINSHFATISPYGYLPGIDMDSLDELFSRLTPSIISSRNGEKYTVGLLLIDTDQMFLYQHYLEQLNSISDMKVDKSILHYISPEYMLKDLEENRIWAGLYCSRAISHFGKDKVKNDTVYISNSDSRGKAIDEVIEFLNNFDKMRKESLG